MSTPPNFGGRAIEEGMAEDLGAPAPEHGVTRDGEDEEYSSEWGGNEAHAAGRICEMCGAVITPGQEVRRRADGQWMHELCPIT